MLVGAVALLSVLVTSCALYRSSVAVGLSDQFLLYGNVQNVRAFASMMAATFPGNASSYAAWISAVYLCAKADGIVIEMSNGTAVISTAVAPRAYEVIRLNS